MLLSGRNGCSYWNISESVHVFHPLNINNSATVLCFVSIKLLKDVFIEWITIMGGQKI